MMEKKLKHLEFIQNIISRMAQNSFLIKGWSITIISALFALSAKDSEKQFIFIAYLPAILFWILDSYYLYQERLFRSLYEEVSKSSEDKIDFLMGTKDVKKKNKIFWIKAFFSKTLLLFYLVLLTATIIIQIILK